MKFLIYFNLNYIIYKLFYIFQRIFKKTLYKNKKIICILFFFIFLNFIFFYYVPIYIFIYIYKIIYLYFIDYFLLFLIDILYSILDFLLDLKYKIIKKIYTMGNFFYFKKILYTKIYYLDNFVFKSSKKTNKYYLQRYITFPFFKIFEPTSFYKKLDYNNILSFQTFYKKKRLGLSSIKTRILSINTYGKTPCYRKYINIGFKNYTYIYTSNYLNRLTHANFAKLFIRNNLSMIINKSGFLASYELLNYRHNFICNQFKIFQFNRVHAEYLMKIGIFNYRAQYKTEITSFGNSNFSATLFDLKKTRETLMEFRKFRIVTYRRDFKKSIFYLFRTFDSYYKIGTTKMYFRNHANKTMIEFLSLNTNFYFYIYYTFLKMPFFFQNFYLSYNKEMNITIPLKIFFSELFKKENIYIIFFFFYSCYFSYKIYLYREVHSLYGLLYFKRHLLGLLFFAFIFKFYFETYNLLTTELYFLLFLPGFYNMYVFEDYYWYSWQPLEKVRFQYTFNHDFSLLHPYYILLLYFVSPSCITQLFIFKIIIFMLFLNYFRKVDFRWKTIIKKNIFFYFYIFMFFIFYTKFFYLNEINLRKKKIFFFNKMNARYVEYKLNFNLNKLLYIQFDLYSRAYLKNLILKNKISNIIFFKNIFQIIFFYYFCFIFFLGIFLMIIKIFLNLYFILIFYFINNNSDLLKYLNNFEFIFYFIKNNYYVTLYKEYIFEQTRNYKNYQIIGRYPITQAFRNRNQFKYKYPFLYSYRLTKNYNNYFYWLLSQKGNNIIGEFYYTNTIINDLLKKNYLYFYKYEIYDLDLKKYKKDMLKNKSYYFANKRKILRKHYSNYNLYETQFKYNFINISDYFFIYLFNKNAFLLKSPYLSINNLITYQRYGYYFKYNFLTPNYTKYYLKNRKDYNYIKTNGNFYVNQIKVWYLNYSNSIYINNYLFVYTKFFKKGGLSLITWLQIQKENEMNNFNFFYKSLRIINKLVYNKLDIYYKNEIYDKFIPTRVDYIKFHDMLTYQMYSKTFKGLDLEKDFIFYEKKIEKLEKSYIEKHKKINLPKKKKTTTNFFDFFKFKKRYKKYINYNNFIQSEKNVIKKEKPNFTRLS